MHHAAWPTVDELPTGGTPELLDELATVLNTLRGAKSEAKVSMKTEIERAQFGGTAEVLEALKGAEGDLRAVGRITGDVRRSSSPRPDRRRRSSSATGFIKQPRV